MTDGELQELSRQAAGLLPRTEAFRYWQDGEGQRWKLHEGAFNGFEGWLHEDTAACAEIMVRVLWPAGAQLVGTHYYCGTSFVQEKALFYSAFDFDPMLAFRVAVLRALIALKG